MDDIDNWEDIPHYELCDEVIRLRAERDDLQVLLRGRTAEFQAEIERLRRWKDEATSVLLGWEAVWEFAGKPGVLGEPKSIGLLNEIERLRISHPADWDGVSHCVVSGCRQPATHHRPFGLTDDGDPITELVCCAHSGDD